MKSFVILVFDGENFPYHNVGWLRGNFPSVITLPLCCLPIHSGGEGGGSSEPFFGTEFRAYVSCEAGGTVFELINIMWGLKSLDLVPLA